MAATSRARRMTPMSISDEHNEQNERNTCPMPAYVLYRSLLCDGASLSVEDGKLRIGPARLATPAVRNVVALHRDELIRLVEAGARHDDNRLYELNESNELNCHDPA